MKYEDIIKGLDKDKIISLMTQLGVTDYICKENCIIFPTICHNENAEDASMKLYYYFDTHIFYCYTSCEAMSIYKFLENYYKTHQIEYDWYEDVYEVALNCSTARNFTEKVSRINLRERYEKKEMPQLVYYPKGVLDVFNKFYAPEWLNDGISKETMDKFNILYSISQNKIIIPHYDVDGNLVGIRGRALNEWEVENVGKYMPVRVEQVWYKHPLSLNLYGLNENKENIRKNGYVFVFEAEKSVLQFESFKQPNCAVAVCGSNFNKYQLKLLLKECRPKEIIICFDNEEDNADYKYFNKLLKIGKKYQHYCKFSFIYDIEKLLDKKDSPTDKGEEIFNRLKEKRVIVR